MESPDPGRTEKPYHYLAPFLGAPRKWLPVVRDHPSRGRKENLAATKDLRWEIEQVVKS